MDSDGQHRKLEKLASGLEGKLMYDPATLIAYATDASVYREIPCAVICPFHEKDIIRIINFARENKIPLIPRGAGTSLAGQVVGNGIIVDISRYMTKILEFNVLEKWVRVEPGIILDELNSFLEPFGLFFAPDPSPSNRCNIGGMVGNNAAGAHSLIYGTTRDHIISARAVLSDGSVAEFGNLTRQEFEEKCRGDALENNLYRIILKILSNPENCRNIRNEYPDPEIIRRNTGYALDSLLDTAPFLLDNPVSSESVKPFNYCKILSGSEGTLALITELKLNLLPLPPANEGLICAHFNSVQEAIQGNLLALRFNPGTVELLDKTVLDCTKENIEQRKNRFFLQGDPGAILIIEFARESMNEINDISHRLAEVLKENGLGYHYPLVTGDDIKKVWSLRKAGLGVLSNLPGDAKPVPVIEDTAVNVGNLADYIRDVQVILKKFELECVYYAHISVGELHMRPVLNLKDARGVVIFRRIAEEMARLIKKYRGSFSGEHGDGRVRAEFIPMVIGEANYSLLKEIKKVWDPECIFNPGKIIDPKPMDQDLRYLPGQMTHEIETIFDFSDSGGILRHAEQCNGSGDCRKLFTAGGTMCPSYMATLEEKTTTRARANLLREFLTYSGDKNPFNNEELYDILDLCLSCKGCKSECPSNVDMTKLKAEFLQHYYDKNGIPLRTKMIAYITLINKIGAIFPRVFNFFIRNRYVSGLIKQLAGFATQRSIPILYKVTLAKWCRKNLEKLNKEVVTPKGTLYLFVDEFSNYNDVEIGIITIKLLNKLGYRVLTFSGRLSGRTFLSKGLLRTARKIAVKNVKMANGLINEKQPLIGIEPSAILCFRDEYPELVGEKLKDIATGISQNVLMLDEFLMKEMSQGNIKQESFTRAEKMILLHGHCQQKAIASTASTKYILSYPTNYRVEEIPSGCCGMAGSFGYEKEHYDLSLKVGELVLFPAVRQASDDVIISAPGTSCRQQIMDGTGRRALHPAVVLWEALA